MIYVSLPKGNQHKLTEKNLEKTYWCIFPVRNSQPHTDLRIFKTYDEAEQSMTDCFKESEYPVVLIDLSIKELYVGSGDVTGFAYLNLSDLIEYRRGVCSGD